MDLSVHVTYFTEIVSGTDTVYVNWNLTKPNNMRHTLLLKTSMFCVCGETWEYPYLMLLVNKCLPPRCTRRVRTL